MTRSGVLATGAVNGSRGVTTATELLNSVYGQVLLLKLGLVLIAAALGGHNRFFEMPKLLSALKPGVAARNTCVFLPSQSS